MSALPQGDGVGIGNGLTAYDFRQPVAIPVRTAGVCDRLK